MKADGSLEAVQKGQQDVRRPDIVLILSDEHAPHFSSIYGNDFVATPNLARLAGEGMTFDAAYCSSPLCVPSRMSFMTGRYPSRIGCFDNGSPLPSDIPTLAHVLSACGYETVLIGKMHFIGPDQLHGFERRPVDDARVCGNAIEAPDWSEPLATISDARSRLTTAGIGHTPHLEQDEDVLHHALQFIEERAAAGPERRPVFLCISFNAPHFPLKVPEHYFARYKHANIPLPQVTRDELDAQHPFHKRLRRYFDIEEVDEAVVAKARAAYFGLVAHLDDMIGAILNAMDGAAPRGFDPLLCYASDHGEMLGEHGLWWKCCLFEESVRVPLIIRWPGVVEGGERCAVPVSLLDLSVTFADLAGASQKPATRAFVEEADGESLKPTLAGGTIRPERAVVSEYLAHAAERPIRMIRQGSWKYVYYHGEPDELFHLDDDPRERTNLAERPDLAGMKAALRGLLLEGWSPDELDRRIRQSQRERRLIAAAEGARA
ncbi:sulfatase-like hydrolase/transferase [Chelativorans sp.]|uniref:sulfatase-like hydrolase/transferase n=1 Tax=Chelativorans sp. TaxID=2203393 RepID=UPI0028114203|nr:sulfatase-like hydrolase/transferase [Chelativorans sp.]